MRRIEVEFAIDVEVSDEQDAQLYAVISDIVKANTPAGMVHWIVSGGHKPLWSDADVALFPDLGSGRSGRPSGEPDYDEDTYYLQTACRAEAQS